MRKLEETAKREALLLPEKDFSKKQTYELEVDEVANHFLNNYTTLYNMKAGISTGDGDCLFNSVSSVLVGNETLSIELRYRCAIQRVLDKDKIKRTRHRSSFLCLSPSDEDALLDALVNIQVCGQ